MVSLFKMTVFAGLFAIGVYYLKQYAGGGVCESKARIDGKVVIVTGANTGIGKETAIDLVKRGGKIYMACRSMERCNNAATDIKNLTEATDKNIITMKLDLASLKSVRQFAEDFKKKERRLDILINNAGVMWVPEGKTEDGFETTLGVNHLGHFLLTHLLLDLIKRAAPSRIINVSSLGHKRGIMDFDDLMYEKKPFSTVAAYGQSKLANVLYTRQLAQELKGTGVTTYSLHPGAIITELARHLQVFDMFIVSDVLKMAMWPFVKNTWQGAQTQICCAVAEELASESGKYYSDCVEKEPSSVAQSDEDAKKLWDISMKFVGL